MNDAESRLRAYAPAFAPDDQPCVVPAGVVREAADEIAALRHQLRRLTETVR